MYHAINLVCVVRSIGRVVHWVYSGCVWEGEGPARGPGLGRQAAGSPAVIPTAPDRTGPHRTVPDRNAVCFPASPILSLAGRSK